LTRTVPALKRYYENGLNMNQMLLQSRHINFRKRTLLDNDEFNIINQSFVDEQSMVPMEVQMVKSMFSKRA